MHPDSSATVAERVSLPEWQADPERWRGARAVVVDGAFADSTAVATWTPQRLAARFPSVAVEARHVRPEAWGDWSLVESEPTTVARFVELLGTGATAQILQQPIGPFPGLLEELNPGRMVDPPYTSVNLYLGRGTRTPLHYDWQENLFVQVFGSKQFVLEPPDSPAGRYVHDGPSAHISRVDPRAPDPVRFPAYDPDRQRSVLLAAGDALYLPPGWFHDVTAPGTSISVNCWFGEFLGAEEEARYRAATTRP
ncbi:cupin-like domain-containing protein [Pseudonocardia sp. TMWB2A]|uniref:cupin-like domain-containing protein n=1 Tax=Pseudonocardia sp. TMWB2A TaxID=687430 RepID=UPI00307CCF2D